ncbi:MAG: peptidoglycan DD-metalloendopeptidase family protein [Candidatus Peregrinibacteria bacterium]|nr:peptidoglycan DD-metalloendopeptidase family protein [Candidatus Peregrinibacteria bacterium]MDZ4245339.1 peptidoglycan DD-metalloendopeptidase family protein [Candidatus Gracilibacteria bacterium]
MSVLKHTLFKASKYKIFVFFILLVLIINSSSISLAAESADGAAVVIAADEDINAKAGDTATDSSDTYEQSKTALIQDQEDLLKSLKKRLRHSVNELSDVQNTITEFHFEIAESEERVTSLEEQITNIDDQIARKEDKIVNITKQIGVKELEIGDIYEQIDIKNLQIEEQAEILSAYLNFLYFQDSTFYDNRGREFNLFKLLLDDNTFSENISEIKFLQLFQQQGALIFERLIALEEALEIQKDNLAINRRTLKLLSQELRDEQTNMEALKDGKKRLIVETQGKQQVYEKLAAKERAEEEQIATEISMLTLNIHAFDSALAKIRSAGNEEEIAEAVQMRDDLLNLKEKAFTLNLGDGSTQINWPISPYRGLTAYFSDESYKAHFGVNHNAVDIRAPQGSPIFAPADGVVFTVKGKGSDDLDYHYVIVTHRNGLQTLYGHLSKIIVSEGQFVRKGDIIGLTGGTIGTTGSGFRTTGPHLHFEVHRFGVRVDPLDYLPLGALPIKYIPEDKLKLLYEQELKDKYGEATQYEWDKKSSEQKDANTKYEKSLENTDESVDVTDETAIPNAEEILKDDAFNYLERYEELRKQYEGE